jgi:hypothetical protein
MKNNKKYVEFEFPGLTLIDAEINDCEVQGSSLHAVKTPEARAECARLKLKRHRLKCMKSSFLKIKNDLDLMNDKVHAIINDTF